MKRALFISKNLIGDGLNISPALRAWHALNPNYEIDLLTLQDQTAIIYERMGVPLTVLTDPMVEAAHYAKNYDLRFNFDVNTAFRIGQRTNRHITSCYAMMLGVDIGTERRPTFEPIEEDHAKGLALLSLFSRSCASQQGLPPNKMLPWNKSSRLIELMREVGPIGILGKEDDQVPIFKDSKYNVVENEYYRGLPLNHVALMLRDAKVVLTVDNGISHLAASQGAKSIVLYPACLDPRWIAPVGNDNAVIMHIDPVTVPLPGMLKAIRDLLGLMGLV